MKVPTLIFLLMLTGCATRLVTLNNSVHFGESVPNQNHHGIGMEVELSEGLWTGFIAYDNSYNIPSRMLTLGQEWEVSKNLYAGIKCGVAYSGYFGSAGIAGATFRYKWGQIFFSPVLAATGLVLEFE